TQDRGVAMRSCWVCAALDPTYIASAMMTMVSGCVLQAVGEVAARCGRWQGLAVLGVELDGFLDNPAKLVEDLPLVITVAAAQEQARRTADVALILVRPFDDLHVLGTVLHVFESSIARRTARIW